MISCKRLKKNQEFECSFMCAYKPRSKLRFQKDNSDWFWFLNPYVDLLWNLLSVVKQKKRQSQSETLFESEWGYKWGGGHGFILTLVCSAILLSEISLLYAPNFYSAVGTRGIVLNQHRYLMVTENYNGWYGQSCPAPIEYVVQSKAGGVELQISSCFIK